MPTKPAKPSMPDKPAMHISPVSIKRARDFYLYTYDGRRLLDLSMNNGFAPLGHKPRGYSQAIKQAVDKGVWGTYPNSVSMRRCERAVETLLSVLFDKSSLIYEEWCFEPLDAHYIQEAMSSDVHVVWYPFSGMSLVDTIRDRYSTENHKTKKHDVLPLGDSLHVTIVLPFEWARHWGVQLIVSGTSPVQISKPSLELPTAIELSLIHKTIEVISTHYLVRPPIRHRRHRTDILMHHIDSSVRQSTKIHYVSVPSHKDGLRLHEQRNHPKNPLIHSLDLPQGIKSRGAYLYIPKLRKDTAMQFVTQASAYQIHVPADLRVLVLPQWMSRHDFSQFEQFFKCITLM